MYSDFNNTLRNEIQTYDLMAEQAVNPKQIQGYFNFPPSYLQKKSIAHYKEKIYSLFEGKSDNKLSVLSSNNLTFSECENRLKSRQSQKRPDWRLKKYDPFHEQHPQPLDSLNQKVRMFYCRIEKCLKEAVSQELEVFEGKAQKEYIKTFYPKFATTENKLMQDSKGFTIVNNAKKNDKTTLKAFSKNPQIFFRDLMVAIKAEQKKKSKEV